MSPDVQKKAIQTSASATQIYWWRALPDPTWDEGKGKSSFAAAFGAVPSSGSRGQYRRVLQTGFPFIIMQDERVLRRFFQPGTWETGSVAVGFDPDVCALSEHDWIVPKGTGIAPHQIGRSDAVPGSGLDTRGFTQKEVVVRGQGQVSGQGTVTITGNAVAGVGTGFLLFFFPGDVLKTATGFLARVVSVASDTTLTLDASPGAAPLTGMTYFKGVDRLRYGPVARIISVVDEHDFAYNVTADVHTAAPSANIAPETEGIITWSSPTNSPPPGTRYGVLYDHYTRYVISDLGSPGAVIAGVPMLSVVMAALWKPDR